MLREISLRQFNAYCYVRHPALQMLSQEVAWFEARNKKLLAAIIFDRTDSDYGHIILARDSRKLFRCISVSKAFFPSPEEAIQNLKEEIGLYLNDGQECYPQGDERIPPTDIFKPVVDDDKLHPYFKVLSNEPRFEAARNLIQEIAYSFEDVDGNYIQQFQTAAFDARLWELFLHVLFYNAGFECDKSKNIPDFWLKKFGYECFVEAVTVGPNESLDVESPTTSQEITELSINYLPIKFGSPLFNKISRNKQYWDMDHVTGKPFILAIHDYHIPAASGVPGSMTWSRAGLSNYLYGVRDVVEFTEEGKTIPPWEITSPKMEKITEHRFREKVIPSNFFAQPNAQHVSAVLFANGATITTFNRMGKLAGLGSKDIQMIRTGVRANPDFRSPYQIPFSMQIDDPDYEESWSDTVVMFHNPNALKPVNPDMFPQMTHITYDQDEEQFYVIQNPNEIYSSATIVVMESEESTNEQM